MRLKINPKETDMSNSKSGTVATYTKKELAGYLTGLAGQNIIYNIIATCVLFSERYLPAGNSMFADFRTCKSMGRRQRPDDGHNR